MLNINRTLHRNVRLTAAPWLEANRTFMVYAPTGSGKPAWLRLSPPATLVVVSVSVCRPYTILINQTAQRFTEYGLPEDQIGFIWRDHPNYDPNR
jgi:superfamily II DNA or RNA helicase